MVFNSWWRHLRTTMTDAWLFFVSGNLILLFEMLMVLGDEFNACSRQPRTRLTADIPCNFSDVMYCSTPGSDYPWQPLIKFLNDNRGLMKRMYGDTRQSVLLRHEIEVHNIRVTTAAARSLELDETTFSFEDDTNASDVTPTSRAREGVNACPSQVEVVSPYWANNTRGEAVAILNIYPFEQFVYFEKCTDENLQMYCREGCRCEQQYGLQRLLAFDPRNECRGIFSDWFRFPSCCVCRCYDVTQSENYSAQRIRNTEPAGATMPITDNETSYMKPLDSKHAGGG